MGDLLQENHRALHITWHMSSKYTVLYTLLLTWLLSFTFSSSRGLGNLGSRPWSRVHMMRSGRSEGGGDPRMIVREPEDYQPLDNEEQESFAIQEVQTTLGISKRDQG